MKAWSSKDPLETYPISIDFSSLLPSGETLASSSWSASTYSGNDSSPSSVLSGSSTVTGSQSKQTVTGGVNGVTYQLQATVVTSGGSTFLGTALLPVKTQTP